MREGYAFWPHMGAFTPLQELDRATPVNVRLLHDGGKDGSYGGLELLSEAQLGFLYRIPLFGRADVEMQGGTPFLYVSANVPDTAGDFSGIQEYVRECTGIAEDLSKGDFAFSPVNDRFARRFRGRFPDGSGVELVLRTTHQMRFW